MLAAAAATLCMLWLAGGERIFSILNGFILELVVSPGELSILCVYLLCSLSNWLVFCSSDYCVVVVVDSS